MSVERVDDISHEEFMTRFLKPGVPVIFKNASSSWKARELFTPEWFRKTLGDKRKTIHGVPTACGSSWTWSKPARRKSPRRIR